MLAPLRDIADEVVIGVDATRRDPSSFETLADRVVAIPAGQIGGSVAAVHAACRGTWVLRIDSDEVASPALIAALPGLIESEQVHQYACARRWLTPDGAHWIDEQPWWPDWQVRLVRRSSTSFSSELHEPANPDATRVHVPLPIYHADAALRPAAERRRKVLTYEIVERGGPGTLREPSAIIFEPERLATTAPVAVPAGDQDAIDQLLSAGGAPRGAAGAVVPVPTHERRPVPDVADATAEVSFEILERDLRFQTDQPRSVALRVTNSSSEPWVSGSEAGDRGHAAAYRWHFPDGSAVEGMRTLLPIVVAPGDSITLSMTVIGSAEPRAVLEFAVVDEHVRWLTGTVSAETRLVPFGDDAYPVVREVRPGGDAQVIPKVIHRVWLGGGPMPAHHVAFGDTWAKHHPDWEMRLWTDADFVGLAGLENARSLSERSDIARFEILRTVGGVYVDTDVECLRPIDGLLAGVVGFSSYEVPGRLCTAVMGAVPGHAAFEEASRLVAMVAGHGTYPQATATVFSTYVLEAHPDVTLFSADRFYPELWDGRRNLSSTGPYAIHHWAQSWAGTPGS